ncbi:MULTISPECIES: cold-inducible protein YdjO-related protein [Paenibacillus]|uniref:Cold-inducible protein YdjO n=1 Tax=Paenibacillus naphthalenovorans TaxID=162209 RepID=A0A0U2IMM1_9BACL|nr:MULTISPECIES: cold-inducible protein YdjO-related protein [Paenibacillus]ALS22955.1 cold-inducible protein YdjO [Paenibacillus naphthalenovorans]NTZ17448.1 cold-shock protein [Paenibacillus sp. JMULE4]GCL71984.1 hypothetical protein PN4B1_18890 [Paenibacillus naphthalenovorans]SDI44294.1 Cold-inducible protein YdjO [Paenibacillus naphthalenovorans]
MSTSTSEAQTQEMKEIQIWKCKDSECNAWIRDEFVTEAAPSCPLCSSMMEQSKKQVPLAVKKVRKTFIMGKRRF